MLAISLSKRLKALVATKSVYNIILSVAVSGASFVWF